VSNLTSLADKRWRANRAGYSSRSSSVGLRRLMRSGGKREERRCCKDERPQYRQRGDRNTQRRRDGEDRSKDLHEL